MGTRKGRHQDGGEADDAERGTPPPARPLPAATAELRAEVRAFLAGERAAGRFAPACDAWLSGWDEGFSRRLAGRGWVGMTVPPEYGGPGRSALERYVVAEEVLAAGAPVAAHWVADRQIVPNLLRYGSEALKRRYLPSIVRGECYFAIGLSEPDTGSDLAAVRTAGTRADGGWRVSGTKIWTSGAHRARAFIALLRTGPPDGRQRHVGLSQLLIGPGDLRAGLRAERAGADTFDVRPPGDARR
jgi:acyl-CoA dehydrogenase